MVRDGYRVRVLDYDYFKDLVECRRECPVGTDARGYVTAIAQGRYEEGYGYARGPNPFPAICGRICGSPGGAPCETGVPPRGGCRRGKLDAPISIRALKRIVTESCGVEAIDDAGKTLEYSTAPGSTKPEKRDKKVAVIGAGMAGLSAAHDLARLGYEVTVFEAADTPGGMLMSGVPLYRLPRGLVQKEIDAIKDLGVEIRCKVRLGEDITIPELQEKGYEAIFIAAGLQRGTELKIDGAQLNGVYLGIDFLRAVNAGIKVELGKKTIVIGGGNVAFDVARTTVRALKDPSYLEDKFSMADTSRAAIMAGAEEVTVVCLESEEEMPAFALEVEEALEEGIKVYNRKGPKKIIGGDGKVKGLETIDVASVFDEDGKFNPKFAEGTESQMEADSIIVAVGQSADFSLLKGVEGMDLTPRGTVQIDPETCATSVPGIFAGGDIATGPRLFIHAVATGQKAALSIHEYVSGEKIKKIEWAEAHLYKEKYKYGMPEGWFSLAREEPSIIPLEKRSGRTPVELAYDEETAIEQGKRCLMCHIVPTFDSTRCIMCNGCVDICPTNCLKLVKLSDIFGDEDLTEVVNSQYGIDLDEYVSEKGLEALSDMGSAMLYDDTQCIRCGHCSKRCPTDAWAMTFFEYKKEYQVEHL